MAAVLKAILLDQLVVWQHYKSKYVLTTTIYKDPIVQSKDLLIYSFTGFDNTMPKDVIGGFNSLKKVAKKEGCSNIMAFVTDDRIKRFLKMIGLENVSEVFSVEIF